MHFHSRCNVNFICSSTMSLHSSGAALEVPIDSKWSRPRICISLELLMHSLKIKQTMLPKTDTDVLPSLSANGRGDTSPQIQVINPNRGRFVLISKKFKT